MPRNHAGEKPKNFKSSLRVLWRSLRSMRAFLVIATVAVIISTILSVLGPAFLGNITNAAYESLSETRKIDWEPISFWITVIILVYLVSAVFSFFANWILGLFASKYSYRLRKQILEKINRLPISYFDTHPFGDTLSRMTNDVDTLMNTLQNSLSEMISNVVTLVGILAMMLIISPTLTLIALVSIPISTIFVKKIVTKAQIYFRAQQDTLGALNAEIEEDYAGQLVIKTNSHTETTISDFTTKNEKLYDVGWKAQFLSSIAFPITTIFTNLAYVAICIVGGYMAIAGQILIGNVQAFIQYTNQFNRPITAVANIMSQIQLALAAAERVFDFLDEKESTPDPAEPILLTPAKNATNAKSARSATSTNDAKNAKSTMDTNGAKNASAQLVHGAVEFSHVTFGYDPEKPVIKDFSCKIKPGSQVALVGPTGAGKTTIVNLLMRFYDPEKGTIKIDGADTKAMKREDVRKLFGMVLQDTWLFSGTIEENLRYGKRNATKADVIRACKTAHIHHFIRSLDKGYETEINEDSDNISAGEKQLLTIARAMIADPPMMILDEATSNVDTRTERLIQSAFDKLTSGRTSFVIAHRLSTIMNADLILVINHGEIVEQGTHDELLKKNGFYANLYNSQFSE